MLNSIWKVLTALAVLVIATPSEACRAYRSPAEMLASGHQGKIFSAVVLVRIGKADYTSGPLGDAHPWRASAEIERVLSGSYEAKEVQFERGFGSSSCDDREPVPNAGDLWIVYFWTRPDNTRVVWVSYPADVASAADPVVAPLLR